MRGGGLGLQGLVDGIFFQKSWCSCSLLWGLNMGTLATLVEWEVHPYACVFSPLVEELSPALVLDVKASQVEKRTHSCLHVLQGNVGVTGEHRVDVSSL